MNFPSRISQGSEMTADLTKKILEAFLMNISSSLPSHFGLFWGWFFFFPIKLIYCKAQWSCKVGKNKGDFTESLWLWVCNRENNSIFSTERIIPFPQMSGISVQKKIKICSQGDLIDIWAHLLHLANSLKVRRCSLGCSEINSQGFWAFKFKSLLQ